MDATTAAAAAVPRRRTWGPAGLTDVVGVGAALLTTVGVLSYLVRGATLEELHAAYVFSNASLGIVGVLGMTVALRHQPGNRAARFLFIACVASSVHIVVTAGVHAIAAADPDFAYSMVRGTVIDLSQFPPFAAVLHMVSSTVWVLGAVTGLLGVPLLPDGAWASRRWRVLEPAFALAGILFGLAWALYLRPGRDAEVVVGELPQGTPLIEVLFAAGSAGIAVCAAAAVGSLIVKLRRADAEQRRRLAPVGVAAIAMVVLTILLYPWQTVWAAVEPVTLSAFVLAVVWSMTRRRLFDVDVLVSRAVTAAVLAAFVTLGYVGIVVGVGWLLGDADNLLAALIATALVAVAFEPLRRRVATWARHLALGRRASPGDVLQQLSERLADAETTDDVLHHVARLLVDGTGAVRAEVHSGGTVAATAGRDPGADAAVVRRRVPVAADGLVLGEVQLVAARADLLAEGDDALLRRVAALLGPVLRNALLTDELQQTVEELRASRQRLVLAEETVRRSVERDIHDGAQQQLLGLRLQLGLASTLAEQGDIERLHRVVDEAAAATDDAIRGLRDLARGILPPVLQQEGLVAALRAHLRQVPLDAAVDAPDDVPRLDAGIEAAVYLVCLEAVQNVTKHADADLVTVRLRHDDAELRVAVVDDGHGFATDAAVGVGLQSITDRIDALGGTVVVDSAPGEGTRLVVSVPTAAPVQPPQSVREESPVSAR